MIVCVFPLNGYLFVIPERETDYDDKVHCGIYIHLLLLLLNIVIILLLYADYVMCVVDSTGTPLQIEGEKTDSLHKIIMRIFAVNDPYGSSLFLT